MVEKDDVLKELERMSRERFQRLSLELLESIGFEITSVRSLGGDIEAEAELEKEGTIEDYIIRVTRSGGEPDKEVEGMKNALGPGVKGFYLTTRDTSDVVEQENIEVAGKDGFFEILKEYDLVPRIENQKDSGTRTLASASEQDRLLRWGDEFKKKGDLEKALEYYDKALENKPEDIAAVTRKAETLIESDKILDAMDLIEETLESSSEHPKLWYLLGRSYHFLERYNDEIDAYERALDINEDHVPSWKNLGAAFFEKEDYDEALLCFDRVLEVEPKDEVAWNNKGLSLIKKGELKDALNCINNALSIYPDFEDAMINKILVFEKQNRISKAIQVADELTKKHPNNESYHYIKGAFLKEGGYEEDALKAIEKALDLNPNYDAALKLKEKLESEKEEELEQKRSIEGDIGEKEEKARKEEKSDFKRIIEEKEDLERRFDKTKRELERVKKRKRELEQELDEGLEDKSTPEEGREEIEQALKEKEEVIQRVKKEKDELNDRLEDIKQELISVRNSKEELEKELEDIRKETDGGEKEIVKKLEEQKEEIERLQEEKKNFKEGLEESSQIINDLKSTKEMLEDELEKIKEGKSIQKEREVEKELEEKEEKIDRLEEEKNELQDKIERLKEEKSGEEKIMKGMAQVRKEEERLKDKVAYPEIELMWKMGEYNRVIESLNGNEPPEFLTILGACYYRQGEIDKAEDIFLKADVELSAKSNLEELYYKKEQYHNSRKISEKIIEKRDQNCVYWERRGESLRRAGNIEDAVLAYLKAEECLKGDLEDFIMAKARCNAGVSGIERGIETINNVPEEERSPDLLNLLGVFLYKNREYQKSIKILRNAAENGKALFYNNLGCAAYKLGRYGEALSSLEKGMKLDPDDLVYLNNLGYCQLKRNLTDPAYKTLKRGYEVSEQDPITLYNFGLVEKQKGIDGWKKKVEKAVELSSGFDEAEKLLEG